MRLFQGFNDGLEELCKTQKGWAIPNKEQRDFIRQAQKKVVSDAYRNFLQRWDPPSAPPRPASGFSFSKTDRFSPGVPTSPSPRTQRSISNINRRRWRRWLRSCLIRLPDETFILLFLIYVTLTSHVRQINTKSPSGVMSYISDRGKWRDVRGNIQRNLWGRGCRQEVSFLFKCSCLKIKTQRHLNHQDFYRVKGTEYCFY